MLNLIPATWIRSSDSYGTSWCCSECGAHVFYEESEPQPCDHKPDEWETALKGRREKWEDIPSNEE